MKRKLMTINLGKKEFHKMDQPFSFIQERCCIVTYDMYFVFNLVYPPMFEVTPMT